MMNTTHVSRGLRGDYSPGRGDMTGARYMANLADKDNREAAVTHTINSLREDPIVIVPERGGASWACPKHLVELIRSHIERGTL